MSGFETIPFAAMPALEGRVFAGDAFSLTGEEQDLFERATWIDRVYPDPDPPEFPEQIIEGFYALGLLDALQKLCFRVDPEQSYGYNYGLDRVRFARPLFLGDRILPRFEIASVERRGDGFLMRTSAELRVEGAEGPGVVADWLTLALPRDGFELRSDSSA